MCFPTHSYAQRRVGTLVVVTDHIGQNAVIRFYYHRTILKSGLSLSDTALFYYSNFCKSSWVLKRHHYFHVLLLKKISQRLWALVWIMTFRSNTSIIYSEVQSCPDFVTSTSSFAAQIVLHFHPLWPPVRLSLRNNILNTSFSSAFALQPVSFYCVVSPSKRLVASSISCYIWGVLS